MRFYWRVTMKRAAVLLVAVALAGLPVLAAVAAEENELKVTVTGLN